MMKVIPETPCVFYIVYLIFIFMLLCCWTNNKERRIFSLNPIGGATAYPGGAHEFNLGF